MLNTFPSSYPWLPKTKLYDFLVSKLDSKQIKWAAMATFNIDTPQWELSVLLIGHARIHFATGGYPQAPSVCKRIYFQHLLGTDFKVGWTNVEKNFNKQKVIRSINFASSSMNLYF